MSGTKHTPGPWQCKEAWDDDWVIVAGEAQVAVASDYPRAEANARLIAAAPAMRALASHVLTMADDAHLAGHPEWQEIVKEAQAIAAATGQED